MDRRRVLLGLGVLAASGCSSDYVGRFARLQGPDIEDWRLLPTRRVAAGSDVSLLPAAPDEPWQRALRPPIAGQVFGDEAGFNAFLETTGSTAFVALHQGRIVRQAYFNGYEAASLCKSFSVSKSVLSALFGIAAGDGIISAADRVGDHLTDFETGALADIRLQHLLNCTSGMDYTRGDAPWRDQPQMYYTTDVRRLVRSARVIRPSGEQFLEEDLSPLLLGVVLESALRRHQPEMTLSAFASARLWMPLGAEADAQWVIDSSVDTGFEKVESGFVARALDLARFGRLFLDRGRVGDRQIIPENWIDACANPPEAGSPTRFSDGYLSNFWWGANRAGMVRSDYFANGHFGQRIYVCPDKQLVLVRLGASRGDADWTVVLSDIAQNWPV